MRNILDTLIEAQLEAFASSYTNTAHDLFFDEDTQKLIHPGEFGGFRESLVRDLLKNFLPEAYGVSQGFVVSPSGDISKQCDIVVYSLHHTPVIRTPEHQRFFPIESVVAVGEVKSVIDGAKLKDALTKLVRIKEMRANLKSASIIYQRPTIGRYDPYIFERDQIGTFLFAETISCQPPTVAGLVREVVENKHPSFKVNLIASVKDYCTSYHDCQGSAWMYPTHLEYMDFPLRFELPTDGQHLHLKLFLSYLLMVINNATIMHPELTLYFGRFHGLQPILETEL
jgi:hypothetical protein